MKPSAILESIASNGGHAGRDCDVPKPITEPESILVDHRNVIAKRNLLQRVAIIEAETWNGAAPSIPENDLFQRNTVAECRRKKNRITKVDLRFLQRIPCRDIRAVYTSHIPDNAIVGVCDPQGKQTPVCHLKADDVISRLESVGEGEIGAAYSGSTDTALAIAPMDGHALGNRLPEIQRDLQFIVEVHIQLCAVHIDRLTRCMGFDLFILLVIDSSHVHMGLHRLDGFQVIVPTHTLAVLSAIRMHGQSSHILKYRQRILVEQSPIVIVEIDVLCRHSTAACDGGDEFRHPIQGHFFCGLRLFTDGIRNG